MPAWTSSLRHQQGSRFVENPTSRQIRLTCIRRGSAGFWSCKTRPGNRVALAIPSLLFELGFKMKFSCRTCRAHSCYFSVATLRPPPKLHGSLPVLLLCLAQAHSEAWCVCMPLCPQWSLYLVWSNVSHKPFLPVCFSFMWKYSLDTLV